MRRVVVLEAVHRSDEYRAAGIAPSRVFAQSFDLNDVLYWLANAPRFGRQAVFLDDRVDQPGGYDVAVASMPSIAAQGVRIIAPRCGRS